jgi:hypothetical protein
VTLSVLRRLERAEALTHALVDPPAVPDPVALFEEAIGPADPWQRDALRSRATRVLMNCCRQSGKSSVAAVVAVHAALHTPGSLTVLVSPTWRQSAELARRAIHVYRSLGRPVPADSENKLSLELSNGSRILSLPGRSDATIRGYSGVALLIADEASRIPDELIAACRPMLAVSGGRLLGLSTPWGQRGWWHHEWAEGEGWERYEVPAERCPRISTEFLAQERRSLGEMFYASEYECRFVDTLDQVFSSEHIRAALDHTVMPLWGAA